MTCTALNIILFNVTAFGTRYFFTIDCRTVYDELTAVFYADILLF